MNLKKNDEFKKQLCMQEKKRKTKKNKEKRQKDKK